MRLWSFLLLAGLASCAGPERSTRDDESMRNAQAAALAAHGTADSLASASVMLGFKRESESLALINRAAAAAPRRPEIIYLQWRMCAAHQCADEPQILADLKRVDPGNGIAWLPDLNAALDREDQSEVTRIVETIGASRGLDIYWNATVVMMVDALAKITAPNTNKPKLDVSARMLTVIGLLAAESIPPMQPLGKACRVTQFDEPGRRAACETMAAQLRRSDSMMIQGLGLSFQTRWSPEGSPEREALKAQRRQFDYLMAAGSKDRMFHQQKDWTARLDAMRRSASEAEVMQAMLISYHEPLERPVNWKDPFP